VTALGEHCHHWFPGFRQRFDQPQLRFIERQVVYVAGRFAIRLLTETGHYDIRRGGRAQDGWLVLGVEIFRSPCQVMVHPLFRTDCRFAVGPVTST